MPVSTRSEIAAAKQVIADGAARPSSPPAAKRLDSKSSPVIKIDGVDVAAQDVLDNKEIQLPTPPPLPEFPKPPPPANTTDHVMTKLEEMMKAMSTMSNNLEHKMDNMAQVVKEQVGNEVAIQVAPLAERLEQVSMEVKSTAEQVDKLEAEAVTKSTVTKIVHEAMSSREKNTANEEHHESTEVLFGGLESKTRQDAD